MLSLLARWVVNAAALLLVAYLYPGVAVASFMAAMIAALVLGLVNALVRPILVILTLPVTILTLGLFLFVINAFMLLITSWIAQGMGLGFRVDGFFPALLGSLIISVVSFVLSRALSKSRADR